jgi:DNA-binding MltR family transcriptional regulator
MADTTKSGLGGAGFDLSDMRRFMDEANVIHEQLKEETDRGAALVGVAFLDELLERLLKSRMLEGKTTEGLFEGSNPLASFSARIDTAYSLGWIGPETHRELHLMRKIRNEFAHVHTPVTFASDAIQNRCGALQIPKAILPARLPRARDQFMFSASMLVLRLEYYRRNTRTPIPAEDPPVHPFSPPEGDLQS